MASEARPHGLPQRLLNDAQFWMRRDEPLIARAIQPRALAGVGVFHPLRAVPYQAADIQLVVEHATTLCRAAVQRRDGPRSATPGLDAARIEVGRDPLAAPAFGVELVDLAHKRRLRRLYLQDVDIAHCHRAIAVRHAASMTAARQLARQPSVRLVAQVVQVDLIDQSAHRPVDLAAAALRVVAVRHADDADAAVLEAAHHAFLLDHVAAEAVQALDKEYRKATCERVGH